MSEQKQEQQQQSLYQYQHSNDEPHFMASPHVPPQTHVRISPSPGSDRNLASHVATGLSEQQRQRGRTAFFSHQDYNGPKSKSNPNSRATSRSRPKPSSRSNSHSRPVSWLVHANSEYTSMYDNYGGSRSRRTSSVAVDEDISSAVEKGRLSCQPSHAKNISGGNIIDGRPYLDKNEERSPSGSLTPLSQPADGVLIRAHSGRMDEQDVPRGTVSATKASLLLGKAFVGTGVLFLPRAFMNGGILFSCFMMIAVAFICCIAFLLLVRVRLIVRENFQNMGLVLFGKYMRLAVLLSVAISQIGFVCAYLIFISQNLFAVVQTFSKCQADHIVQEKYYVLFPLVALIPLVLIRRMAVLSLPSMFANVFIIFGIIYLWYYSINELVHNGAGPNVALFNQNDFALLIGTAVFSFEGIGLIIPITESMAEPEKFPRVLAMTMTVVALIFGSVGALCYAAFGSNVQTVVLLNLPIQGGMTITVEILYSLAIILSVPLMLTPASKIIEFGIFGEKSGAEFFKVKMYKNALRTVLICICAVISLVIGSSNLDKFVAFIGSVACMPLCFIFPALFHYKACAKTMKEKAIDIALGIFGVAAMIFTLFITIRSWVVVGAPEAHLDRCSAFR